MLTTVLIIIHIITGLGTLYSIFSGDKTEKLNKILWGILVALIPVIGPGLYWVVEKEVV